MMAMIIKTLPQKTRQQRIQIQNHLRKVAPNQSNNRHPEDKSEVSTLVPGSHRLGASRSRLVTRRGAVRALDESSNSYQPGDQEERDTDTSKEEAKQHTRQIDK